MIFLFPLGFEFSSQGDPIYALFIDLTLYIINFDHILFIPYSFNFLLSFGNKFPIYLFIKFLIIG